MKKFAVIVATLVFASVSLGHPCSRRIGELFDVSRTRTYFEFAPNRVMDYWHVKPKKGMPTLIMLPGLFSTIPDGILKNLKDHGMGFLSFATSLHWQSQSGLKENTVPHFETNPNVSLNTLANEAIALVEHLKIKNPVAVSLSFSSAIAARLPYPTLHFSPMVKPSETQPMVASWMSSLEQRVQNPREFRDQNLKNVWNTYVGVSVMTNPFSYLGEKPERVANGFVALSRAVENFDLSKEDFSNADTRNFVFAEGETMVRLKHQVQTFLKVASSGPSQLIFVRRAEHFIADTQPEAFMSAMLALLEKSTQTRVGVIDPYKDKNKINWLSLAEAQAVLERVLALPDATLHATLAGIFR